MGEGRRSQRVWRPRLASGEPFPLGRPWTQEAAGCALSVGLCGQSGEGSCGAKAAVGRVLGSGTPSPLGVRSSPKRPLAGRGKVGAGTSGSETPPQVAQKWGAQAAAPLSLSRAASGQGRGLCSPFPKKGQLATWGELLRSC